MVWKSFGAQASTNFDDFVSKKWNISKFKQCYPELENGQEGKINFVDCATKVINERNDLLESVFLCDFNKRACTFKDNNIIKLLRDR